MADPTLDPAVTAGASARPAIATRKWGVVALLFFAVLINYLDRGNLSIVAVPLMNDFGVSPAGVGTLLSAFFWTYTLLQIPVGFVVDRYGLKWTYAAAFVLWSLASAAVGVASSFSQILIFRLMLGVGEAVAQPASLAYIRQNFDEDQQGLPTSVYLSGMMLGPALGAFLGAALLQTLGWRNLFIYTGLGGCIWLLPWIWLAPSGRRRALTAQPRPATTRLPWPNLLKNSTCWGITIGSFFYSYYWYFCLTWIPSYLVMVHGLSFLKMGAYTAAPLLGMAVVSTISGRACDRIIRSRGLPPLLVRRAFVCTGFVLGSSLLLLLGVKSVNGVLAILVFALLGLGVASANYWALTQAISPAKMIGRVIGYQNTIANLAGVCAPILTGLLVGQTRNFHLAILFAGLSLLIAAAAFAFLVNQQGVRNFRAVVGEDEA